MSALSARKADGGSLTLTLTTGNPSAARDCGQVTEESVAVGAKPHWDEAALGVHPHVSEGAARTLASTPA